MDPASKMTNDSFIEHGARAVSAIDVAGLRNARIGSRWNAKLRAEIGPHFAGPAAHPRFEKPSSQMN